MLKGYKGQKHQADVVDNAVHATPEEPRGFPADDGKDKAAQSLGQRGGWARAKALSAMRRKEIAQKAAATRWKNLDRPSKEKRRPARCEAPRRALKGERT